MNDFSQKLLLVCWCGFSITAQAQIGLTKIADANTTVPGAPGTTFKDCHNSALHNGQVLFRAVNSANAPGLYLFNGSAIVKIADTNTPAPNGGTFTNIQFDYGLENGAVAFFANDTNGAALFLWTNGVITRLAKRGDAIPGTATNKFTTFGQPAFDNGVLYFIGADSTNYRGVHRFDGVISTGLVSSLHTYPTTALPHQFSSQLAVENGRLAVWSYASNNATQPNAIFTWSNNVKSFLVSSNDAIPGAGANFYTFQSPPDSADGMVVFWGGSLANFQEGIFLRPFAGGTITPIVRRGDANSGLTGTLTSFNGFALDDGQAWFSASGTGGESLFRWQGGGYSRVLSGGMKIGPRTISSSGGFIIVPGGARNGVAAFVAKFTDTTSGVYLTTNLPPVTNSFTLALTNLVSTNTPLPGGTGNFTFAGSATLWQGGMVFSGNGTNNQGGLYHYANGAFSVIVNRAMIYPGGSTNIQSYAVYAADATRLLIGLQAYDGRQGLFLYDGSALTPIADTTTAIPGGSFGSFASITLARFNGAKLSFFGTGTNNYSGVFEYNGGTLTRLLDTTTIFPGTANPLRVLNYAQQGDLLGITAFDGVSTYGALTFSNGVLNLIATNNAGIPAHPNRVFGAFSSPGFFSGQFHFTAQALSTVDAFSGNYLMRANPDGSGLTVIVDETTFLPGMPAGFGSITYFVEPGGLFASAVNGSQRALYYFNQGTAELLFDNTTPLNGVTLAAVTPAAGSFSTNGAAFAVSTFVGNYIYYSPPAATVSGGGQFTPGSVVWSPSGSFCVNFTGGVIGNSYRIQYNPSLGSTNWVTFTNFSYTGPINICDNAATNQFRFYRAVSP